MGIVVSIVGAVLSGIRLKSVWHESRIGGFKDLYGTLSRSRFIYSFEMLRSYKDYLAKHRKDDDRK